MSSNDTFLVRFNNFNAQRNVINVLKILEYKHLEAIDGMQSAETLSSGTE